MTTLQVADRMLELDDDGFLIDRETWNREVAETLAAEDGITLTERHWEVIEFVRSWHEKKGESPTLRKITKMGGIPTKELYALFPGGPGKKVARISGTPKPEGCV
jgi:tRNA 2-thiouridine synthesizing protein E